MIRHKTERMYAHVPIKCFANSNSFVGKNCTHFISSLFLGGQIYFQQIKKNMVILLVKKNISFFNTTIIDMVIGVFYICFDAISCWHTVTGFNPVTYCCYDEGKMSRAFLNLPSFFICSLSNLRFSRFLLDILRSLCAE